MATPNVVEKPRSLDEKIAFRRDHIIAYQGKRLARRYDAMLARIDDAGLKEAVAKGYHKLLTYKDEYEVARLLLDTREKAKSTFEGDFNMTFHMAPPVLSKEGPDGRPQKRRFGEWMTTPLKILARMKGLRGTVFDPFGRTAERRMERALIAQYEADMDEVLPKLTPTTRDAILALAELPLSIRGFGPVKQANAASAEKRREELLTVIRAGGEDTKRAAQ